MDGTPLIELRAGLTVANISRLGAEWRSWSVDGRALLWAPDGLHWDRVAPLLFPVCGWTREGTVRVGGRAYPLGLHGFASTLMFSVVEQGADHVTLRVMNSHATRDIYPFRFILDVSYRLSPAGMAVSATVRNAGAVSRPYAFGLHPGFCWPLAGGDKQGHRILFDANELAEVPVIAPGGLIGTARRPVPIEGRELALDEALFAQEALCFLDAASRGLTFAGPQGRLRIDLENFPHIVLWSKPTAPFLCIESWTGYGDPEGFNGDLFEKPGMIHLGPGLSRRHGARYAFSL